MIAEAVDAVRTLAGALLAWIVAGAVVATGLLYAGIAGAVWAVNAVRNALRGQQPAAGPTPAPKPPTDSPQRRKDHP